MTRGRAETTPPADASADALGPVPLVPAVEATENEVVTAVFGAASIPPMISDSGGGQDGDGNAQCA